ncbi:ATP-binding protein [Desulfovulcanus sp.]
MDAKSSNKCLYFTHSHLPSLGKKIVVYLILILGLCGVLFFLWLAKQQETFVVKQLRHHARGIYHYIVLTREWISSHGGIYIQEKGNYHLITPSIFTREIALFARRKQPYAVKIATLDSKNPAHIPDQFEFQAIELMQQGRERELWKVVNGKNDVIFRYAAPLIFENECAKCHQNFKRYNILGCISISFPATSLFKEVAKNKNYYFIYLFASLGIVLFLLMIMLKKFVLHPLNQLCLASHKIEQGDLDGRVDLKASKEWVRVGESFNSMVESLACQQKRLEEEVNKAVADLSRAYEDLKRMEKFKSDFFSNITHDLKTPITAIKGASDILAKKLKNGEYETYVDILKRNVTKLSLMVKDLLDCARLESGELELQKEQLDLSEVIEDAVLMVQPLAWERQVEIEYDLPGDPYYVVADRARIEQAISNLLTNAIKFSDRGAKVIVRLAHKDGQVVMSVEDFGPGIPIDEQNMVFKKFYRRGHEKGSDGLGLGLGLAIAKGVVEAHGGKIWISQPDHQGVIMNISLPEQSHA